MIDRFIRWVSRYKPSIFVGSPDDPIMTRYFIIPRNRFFNLYLHHIYRSDDGDLHDHRMANISVILKGRYYEQHFATKPVVGRAFPRMRVTVVERLRPQFRWATTPHRLVLLHGEVWSLFIGLPHYRNWGFYKKDVFGLCKWVAHEQEAVRGRDRAQASGDRQEERLVRR